MPAETCLSNVEMDAQVEKRTVLIWDSRFVSPYPWEYIFAWLSNPGRYKTRLEVSIRHFTPRFPFQVAAHVCLVVEPLSTSHCKIPVVVGCSIDLSSSQSSLVYPAPGSRPGSDWLELCNVVLPLLPTRRGQDRSRSGSTLRSQQGHLQT